MPDIINNVINSLPASGHSIYVTELAPYNSNSIYFQQKKFFGGYRIAKNETGSRAHIWDLYLLSRQMTRGNLYKDGPFYEKTFVASDYQPVFCSNFSDNAGDNVYSPVRNFSGLSVLNHPNFNQYQYSGNFNFNPILSTAYNSQYAAEIIIYRASIIPLYPLLFCSSIPTHKSFGPAFINSFNINVDGMDSLGDVEISCSLIGGRSVISSDNIPARRPDVNDNIIKMKTLDSSAKITEYNNFVNKHRAINLSDCAIYPDLFLDFDNFKKTVISSYSSKIMPPYKIVSMSLSISQSIDFTYTYPGYSIFNILNDFTDIIGPRFASLSDRRVTGSIKIFSPQNFSFINSNASSLTMFFGSVFYYTMQNVDWQQPSITINPGSGYFIEYKFTARMTKTTYLNGFGNLRVSEFL